MGLWLRDITKMRSKNTASGGFCRSGPTGCMPFPERRIRHWAVQISRTTPQMAAFREATSCERKRTRKGACNRRSRPY